MQPIWSYWFARQPQTGSSRQKKFNLLHQNLSPEFSEHSLKFWKKHVVAKIWLKLKHPRKPQICDIRGPSLARQIKNQRPVSKWGPLVTFYCLSLSNAKGLSVKLFLKVTLASLTIRARTVFLNFSKNTAKFAILVCCAAAN